MFRNSISPIICEYATWRRHDAAIGQSAWIQAEKLFGNVVYFFFGIVLWFCRQRYRRLYLDAKKYRCYIIQWGIFKDCSVFFSTIIEKILSLHHHWVVSHWSWLHSSVAGEHSKKPDFPLKMHMIFDFFSLYLRRKGTLFRHKKAIWAQTCALNTLKHSLIYSLAVRDHLPLKQGLRQSDRFHTER